MASPLFKPIVRPPTLAVASNTRSVAPRCRPGPETIRSNQFRKLSLAEFQVLKRQLRAYPGIYFDGCQKSSVLTLEQACQRVHARTRNALFFPLHSEASLFLFYAAPCWLCQSGNKQRDYTWYCAPNRVASRFESYWCDTEKSTRRGFN